MKWKELKDNPSLLEVYKKRLEIIKQIRCFFWQKGFLETDTPYAVRFPGQEPNLNPIGLKFHDPAGNEFDFYLHTSPELSMKKLLGAGLEKIFQIAKCFRDYEGFRGLHNTEFTMLEWYRSPGGYEEIMDDCEELVKFLARNLGADKVFYNNQTCDLLKKWEKITMKDLWKRELNVDLEEYLDKEKMGELCRKYGLAVEEDEAYEVLFYKIFLNKIEPKLGAGRPTIVYDYPAEMASLSRLREEDRRFAERFELYICGVELANAFGELTDPLEQKERLIKEREERRKLGKSVYDIDEDFISALGSDKFKTAAGIALGVDRMVMLLCGEKNLEQVIFQTVQDQLDI